MGRSAELEDLHDLLAQSEQVAIVAATGMGGIGKTRLAWEYTQQHRESYRGGVWWIDTKVEDATDNAELQSEFVQQLLAYGSRMGFSELPDNLGSTEQQAQWCYDQWLAKQPQGQRLLVIDDLRGQSAYRQVKSLWPQDARFRVLLTTRSRFGQPVQCLSLEVLKPSDSLQLLKTLVADDQRIEREVKAAKELCAWVGHLPLGLELVGRHLEQRPNLTIATLLERLEEKRLAAKATRTVPAEMPYEDNIEAAFELSWQPLSDQAKMLAGLLSVFALAPIPRTLIELSSEDWDDEDLDDALDLELANNSLLLDLGNGQYTLHPLIHQFLEAKLGTDLEAKADHLRCLAGQGVVQVAKSIPQTITLTAFENLQPYIPHLTAIANSWTYLMSVAKLTWLMEGLARISISHSLWLDAEKWYLTALHSSEKQLGVNHSETGTILNNLAELYRSIGRYSDAEPLFLRALKIFEEKLGADHHTTGTSLNNLAGLYESTGRYNDAELFYLRALKTSEAHLGEDRLETGTTLNNLAGLYLLQSRYSDAEPLYLRALKISEEYLGADHHTTGKRLHNLASLYEATGRYSDAEPLYLRALIIFEEQLGDDHLETATTLNNLAGLYETTGRYSDAEPLYLKALIIYEEQLGGDHPSIGMSLNNLALLYKSTGRYNDAEPLFLRALQISEEQLGVNHPETGTCLNNLALLYKSTGRYNDAEPLFLRALQISEEQLGVNHPETGTCLNNLAELYKSTGRCNDAEPLFLRALQISEEQLGADHPETGIRLNNLALLYKSTGQYSDAEPLYLRAIYIYVNSLGQDHPSTQTVIGNFYSFCQTIIEVQQLDLLSEHPLTQHLVQEIQASGS